MAPPTTARYEISVRGVLSGAVLSGFPALTGRSSSGTTVLTGAALDQAALHGALRQVERLGLELLAVRRVPGAYVGAMSPVRNDA